MAPPQLVIHSSSGLVQELYCSDPHVFLAVVTWDTAVCSPDEAGLVEVPVDRRVTAAWVGECEAIPLVLSD